MGTPHHGNKKHGNKKSDTQIWPENTKLRKIHKMGHRGSKIGFSSIDRDGFFMKITFPRSLSVRSIAFDSFLKICTKNIKKNKKYQNRQKIILDRSKNKNIDFVF